MAIAIFLQQSFFLQKIIREGFPGYQVIGQIFDTVIDDPNLEEGGKAKIAEKIAVSFFAFKFLLNFFKYFVFADLRQTFVGWRGRIFATNGSCVLRNDRVPGLSLIF